jgi:hypothetical protein
MKYCPKCGTQNGDVARFCKSCGYSFAVAADRHYAKTGTGFEKPSSSYPSYPEQYGQLNRGRMFLLIAAVIVILGAGGFAIWKFVVSKNTAGTHSELENVDLGAGSAASAQSGTVNPEFEKFIGDWYSDNANIKRTRISLHGDLLLVETFFKDGIDSCYGAPSGNAIRCSGDFQVNMVDPYCIEGYFAIRFCKR